MYFEAVEQFTRTLTNLKRILGKAEGYAEARKFDVNLLVQARLYPDMLPFVKQIQIACDVAKATAATLSGRTAPKHEDNETTMEQIHQRIDKCLGFLSEVRKEDFQRIDPAALFPISFPQNKAMKPQDFLLSRAIPNFFFHVSIAYSLLRHNGVEIGKGDFLGELNLFDAPVGK